MSATTDSRSITLIGDYLEQEARTKPELRETYTQLNSLVQKKLWHQVSTQLLSYLTTQPAPILLALQENVVQRIYKKISPFDYAQWIIAIANLNPDVAAGLAQVEASMPHVLKVSAGQTSIEQDDQAVLLFDLEITRRQLAVGKVELDTLKDRLTASKKSLDHYSGVMDARVYASYYRAMYEYSKIKGNPQEYYTNSLLYLTYTPLPTIPLAAQSALASDIGLSALLGKNIYNFGELLQHPILKTLDATEYAWLPKLLQTFNKGDIKEFNTIFEQVKGKYPTLAANTAFLNQKLRIMTLMELVFRLPSGSRSAANEAAASSSSAASAAQSQQQRGRFLTFDAISKGCDLPLDQVEWLLMKSLSLKVIKGEIDQVAQTVRLTWVSPRVLDIEQVKSLKNRLAGWQHEVQQTTVFVENNAQQII